MRPPPQALRRRAPGWMAAAGLIAAAAAAVAQPAAPDVQAMIDALRPPLERNLLVRPRPAGSAAPAASAASGGTAGAAGAAIIAPTPAEPPPGLALDLAFESGSARLRPESGRTLGNLFAAMASPELRDARFVIEGHTDAVGSPAANLRLSQRRADEVAGYLVVLGVAPERLRAVGRGSADPADPLHPRAAVNRRVRVVTQP